MGFPKRLHDPSAVLDYPAKWTDWLKGDTIDTTTAVTKDPTTGDPSAYFTVERVDADPQIPVAWVSAVPEAAGKTATLTFHIETTDGRVDERSLTLVGKER